MLKRLVWYGEHLVCFGLSLLILTSFYTAQTSATNLYWLASIGMPVDSAVVSATLLADWLGMNIHGEVPLSGLLGVALLLAFSATRVVTIWWVVESRYIYALAGAVGSAVLVICMPLALSDMELIAGARSLIGKFYLIAAGGVAGYFFGSQMTRLSK
tara:strand:+ start:305 stop:775 length:471 start_codon:yes stop_codon:yes gene_type:complete